MSIQSSINSMIGSASHAVMAAKGYSELKKKEAEKVQQDAAKIAKSAGSSPQAQAAQTAKQSAANEVEAKRTQKRNFIEYLKKQPTSLGGTVGDLPPAMQKQVASQYTKSQRKRLMDLADREGKNGSNK